MGPQNILIGDSTGVELPRFEMAEDELYEEKKMAKFTRTAEFQRIQEWCQSRIDFYQKCLPNGAEVGLDAAPSPEDWRVANRIIAELTALMNMYRIADEVVREQARKK